MTTERLTDAENPVEAAARRDCAKLLQSAAAQALPRASAEALVILAFTYGAAWALDRPDMIELANANLESRRSAKQ